MENRSDRRFGENPECGYLKLPLKLSGSTRFDEKPISKSESFCIPFYTKSIRALRVSKISLTGQNEFLSSVRD